MKCLSPQAVTETELDTKLEMLSVFTAVFFFFLLCNSKRKLYIFGILDETHLYKSMIETSFTSVAFCLFLPMSCCKNNIFYETAYKHCRIWSLQWRNNYKTVWPLGQNCALKKPKQFSLCGGNFRVFPFPLYFKMTPIATCDVVFRLCTALFLLVSKCQWHTTIKDAICGKWLRTEAAHLSQNDLNNYQLLWHPVNFSNNTDLFFTYNRKYSIHFVYKYFCT